MHCLICDDSFLYAGSGGPAEPCECGRNFSKVDWLDHQHVNLGVERARWQRVKAMTPDEYIAFLEAEA